jgi:hypothetical protein
MKIELTNEMIEMEPGPNLYFMGSVKDFDLFSNIIMKLKSKTTQIILLNEIFDDLEVINPNLKIILKSVEQGNILNKIEDTNVIMELDPSLWGQVLKKILALTCKPSHIYLEFDHLNLREDCNIIMSSEW